MEIEVTIEEIVELFLLLFLLLAIGSSIIIVSNPDYSKAYFKTKEVSYISSIMNKNTSIEIPKEADFKVKIYKDENYITFSLKDEEQDVKNYILDTLKDIKNNKENIKIIK